MITLALFSSSQIEKINAAAEKSKQLTQVATKPVKSISSDIDRMSAQVIEYFKDSQSILITTEDQLADYIDKCITAGYAGIDTETTGLDRIKDTIVGSSLYYPGGVEAYIPNRHKIPIFDDYRKNQLTYDQCQRQFQRLVDNKVKMIFANADFDIAMLYKDYKVDFIDVCYYDCILAWRCIKENELHNGLKELYNKYVLGGKGDPKKFNDFFDVALFPYCKPEVAKLYAANDAKITYDLFRWQLPYITKTHKKCIDNHLEKIADVVWGIEFPMIRVCAMMHRVGSYIDTDVAKSIDNRYDKKYAKELAVLQGMVQTLIDDRDTVVNAKRPFKTGKDFNPTSVTHARYLCYNLLGVATPTSGKEKGKQATSKEVLAELNLPETNQLLKVRSLSTLIGTFVKKLPKTVTPDSRIHAQFRSVGAATGRMSSAEPNLQNIPSHATDIRHMFRATAARNEVYDLIPGEFGTCSVVVSKYDSLYNKDNNLVKLYDLKESDSIIILEGNRDIVATICNIEKIKYCDYRITINYSSDKICRIRIRTPEYAMMSSDYSQQEPKLLSFVIQDPSMLKAFAEGKDIYATIAGLAFNQPYEKCLEFHPETHEYQPDGKRMRGEAKTIVLGICYGRSTVTIGEQLFGTRDDMSDEDKTKEAQKIYDAVLNAFPNLRTGMLSAQNSARTLGYTETILGRRRHIPDMQLPEFEFRALPGYVNPDIDPLDVNTLKGKDEIPERIVNQLKQEYANFKYRGQIFKRNNELYEQHIKVINNQKKITDASRQCLNSVIQGSAAELTKMAILKLFDNDEWHELGGRLLIPVHDELICEVPIENWEKGGNLLSQIMSDAGNFLPFTISCDVETTQRWYGLEYPCPYTEPESLDNLSEDNIKWIQYHLLENEYDLPVYKDENGDKPRGDAAKGVNGIESDELRDAVADYLHRYHITSDRFLEHIKVKVKSGITLS